MTTLYFYLKLGWCRKWEKRYLLLSLNYHFASLLSFTFIPSIFIPIFQNLRRAISKSHSRKNDTMTFRVAIASSICFLSPVISQAPCGHFLTKPKSIFSASFSAGWPFLVPQKQRYTALSPPSVFQPSFYQLLTSRSSLFSLWTVVSISFFTSLHSTVILN